MTALSVSRGQVLGFRAAAQQLDRSAGAVDDLAVLDLGLQEAMGHPAGYAVAARCDRQADLEVGPGRPLALAWTFRGAPHVHRRTDLPRIAGALVPLSEADAAGRLNETGPSVARAGISALEQYQLAVDAMRAVVRTPTGKGGVSTAVTVRLPEPMRHWCRACNAFHISDSAMRSASLPAGVELEPGTNPPVLVPVSKWRVPKNPDTAALATVLDAYLRLLGPATLGDSAGYVEARKADAQRAWPDDLVDVSVDGRVAQLPADRIDDLRAAPAAEGVRLLGPFDPWMQARDRDLIVPEKAVQKALWPVLGRPGVVWVDGEVLGAWRTKTSGRKLTLTVEQFAPLPPPVWDAVEEEAQRVAAVRGAATVTVARN